MLLGCSLTSNEIEDQATETAAESSQRVISGDLVSNNEAVGIKPENAPRAEIIDATIGAQTFALEVSKSAADREMGLMHREAMQYNQGMLFEFETAGRHRFWMKNTLIPLDIIWLNEAKEVVHFATASPCYADPCDIYGPPVAARYVIELPAGSFVEELGTVVEF